MNVNEKKTLVCVTVMVAVFVQEGAQADDATLMLAADTAARLGDDKAQAETVRAEVLFRDRRIVGAGRRGAEIGSRRRRLNMLTTTWTACELECGTCRRAVCSGARELLEERKRERDKKGTDGTDGTKDGGQRTEGGESRESGESIESMESRR
jgi:hypothetical protein